MNESKPILDEIRDIVAGVSSGPAIGHTKLTGALAIEVIRDRLLRSGVSVSARDVFIKGCSTEFDLLVVRPDATPIYGIVYDPRDVAAALEIKFSGVYSQAVPTALRQLFEGLTSLHPHVHCIYVTVCEEPKFKYRMTSDLLGFPAFTLNWWTDPKKTAANPGDQFHAIVDHLQTALSRLPPAACNDRGA